MKSCEGNQGITWVFFTDCDLNIDKPDNILLFKSSLADIKHQIGQAVGFQIDFCDPYKLCDFRPAFGDIFSDSGNESLSKSGSVEIMSGNKSKSPSKMTEE